MEQIFNKLVRDNIPDIIKKNGEVAVTRELSSDEYKEELLKKLQEECNEVINAQSKEETLEELADVLEVLKAISELEDENLDKVIEFADKKRNKKGGFSRRIFLEKTF